MGKLQSNFINNQEDAEVKDYWNKLGTLAEAKRLKLLSHTWASQEFVDWTSSLQEKEIKAFNDYVNHYDEYDKYLQKYQSLLEETKRLDQKGKDFKNYDNNIRTIDGALQRSKISTPIYLYKELDAFQSFPSESKISEFQKNLLVPKNQ